MTMIMISILILTKNARSAGSGVISNSVNTLLHKKRPLRCRTPSKDGEYIKDG